MNAYRVVSALIIVMCVIRRSNMGALLQNINAYIVVSDLMTLKYVIWHSSKNPIL